MFPAAVYVLCFLTSACCAWLLGRSYARSRERLLLWSSACFILLAGNNLLLVMDLLIFTDVNLRIGRLLLSLSAISVLLFGFIWDLEDDAA
ncbi:hypothetical protein G7077_02720 [Sphingomonas piscis]|uniref:Uncharacterized protein n=1 Tax=Sphingomonas piscis TaxID=2714943 RepID=A0A6G7YT31_9SPHN|nr:hypothetical protein G7077_02720 [Sphingomonas piscis]